jgi:hypothetical protein
MTGNPISTFDDGSHNSVQVTLSVGSGALSLNPSVLSNLLSEGEVTISLGSGSNDAMLAFSTDAPDVDALLDGLIYTPALEPIRLPNRVAASIRSAG